MTAALEYLTAVENLMIWRAEVRRAIAGARAGTPGVYANLPTWCAFLNSARHRLIRAREALGQQPLPVRIAAYDAELSSLEDSTPDTYLRAAKDRRWATMIEPFALLTMPTAERVRASGVAAE